MPGGPLYFRRVKRSPWEQRPFVVDDVLPYISDDSVRAGKGLSLWRVGDDADKVAVAAILAVGDKVPSNGPVHVLAIPAEILAEFGMIPVNTPDGTRSSHNRAKDLHHDVFGLDEQAARRLCARLGQEPEDFLLTFRGRDLRPVMESEADAFADPADRERAKLR